MRFVQSCCHKQVLACTRLCRHRRPIRGRNSRSRDIAWRSRGRGWTSRGPPWRGAFTRRGWRGCQPMRGRGGLYYTYNIYALCGLIIGCYNASTTHTATLCKSTLKQENGSNNISHRFDFTKYRYQWTRDYQGEEEGDFRTFVSLQQGLCPTSPGLEYSSYILLLCFKNVQDFFESHVQSYAWLLC